LVSFRAAMERAGLLERRDFKALFWCQTIGLPWSLVAGRAVAECRRSGAKLLVVDTLPQFAGLLGDTENHAGDALRALLPLQQAAAQKIGIVIVRHERKGGGALGESGRGSSAFAGAVDIILSIRRPEGHQKRNIREIRAVSRLGAPDDLLIELTDKGYRSLGAPGEAAKEQAAADVLAVLPESKEDSATIQSLIEDTGKPRAHLQRLLDVLLRTGKIQRAGKGRKGDPYRYFKD
jgi:hypothetical protein